MDVTTPSLGFIVERLNEPPFQMNLTMVAFDEKSPFELLEVVNEVMAHLSAQHKVDLRDETPESTATRMLDFLRVLNYKIVRALPRCMPGILVPALSGYRRRLHPCL
jgi:intraflagellar transport protein 81